jgi:hypothetical protein
MKFKKALFFQCMVFVISFLLLNPGFSQVKKEETIVYGGFIKSISKDYKSILVYEDKILISSNTKIVNEKGKSLKINDLRPELYVVIEGVRNPNGFLAKKITVKKPPEV